MRDPDHTRPRDGNGRFTDDEQAIARQNKALHLRSRGRTLQQIADQLGYASTGAACDAVKAAMARGPRETVEEMRQTMAAQLEHLQAIVAGIAEDTDAGKQLDAAKTMKALMERQAALFGLDAPTRTKVDVEVVDFTIDGVPTHEV